MYNKKIIKGLKQEGRKIHYVMKKIIYLSLGITVFALFSCNSNEKKAQKLIKDYLSKNLNDASSYESVEFSKLDSTFSNFYFSTEGQELTEKQEFAHNRAFELSIEDVLEENPIIQDSIKIYRKTEEDCKKAYEEKELAYIGEFNGWKMTHKYRAKNGLGATILGTTVFTFNKELTEVKSANNQE